MRRQVAIVLAVCTLLMSCDEAEKSEQHGDSTTVADGGSVPQDSADAGTVGLSTDGSAATISTTGPAVLGSTDAASAAGDAADWGRSDAAAGSPTSAGQDGGPDSRDSGRVGQGNTSAADAAVTSPPVLTETPPTSSNEIESVAFAQAPAGNPSPVLLFKGGYACWDSSLAAQSPIDAAAHRMANPGRWSEWQRTASGVETRTNGGGWRLLPYAYEYPPLPVGTPLSGFFERVFSPDPNGDPLVLLVWRYRFHADGTFEYCKTSEIAGEYPVFSKERAARSGTYTVNGYTIRLDDKDGKTDTYQLFYDPMVSEAMWVEIQYLVPSKDSNPICF